MMRYSSPSILISWPEYLPNRIGVAFLDVERRDLAVLLDLALADGDDLALLRLFLGGVRDDDPADLLFAFFDALHDDAVVQGTDLHCGCCCCHSALHSGL